LGKRGDAAACKLTAVALTPAANTLTPAATSVATGTSRISGIGGSGIGGSGSGSGISDISSVRSGVTTGSIGTGGVWGVRKNFRCGGCNR
jgi:hypothetical protein